MAWPVVQRLLSAPATLPSAVQLPGRIVGGAMVLGACLMFRAADRVLGEDLVASPEPRDKGVLHQEGLYARVRHPIYVAILLGLVGWALVWSSLEGLGLSLICLVYFLFKTRAEERYLLQHYPDYAIYASSVPRFVPRRRQTLT
jgi:protein-S-isoprenylcysteine O-methyltransferase Ste14